MCTPPARSTACFPELILRPDCALYPGDALAHRQAAACALRQGALLVNAARRPIVHTDALVEALQAGRIRAALDVTDPEPLPQDHPLWSAPNLLITPHIGATSPQFARNALRVVAAELRRYINGEPLKTWFKLRFEYDASARNAFPPGRTAGQFSPAGAGVPSDHFPPRPSRWSPALQDRWPRLSVYPAGRLPNFSRRRPKRRRIKCGCQLLPRSFRYCCLDIM